MYAACFTPCPEVYAYLLWTLCLLDSADSSLGTLMTSVSLRGPKDSGHPGPCLC